MRGHCESTILCQVLGASGHGGISGFIGKSGIMVHIHGLRPGDKTVFGWFGVRHERCAKNTFTHAHPYSGVTSSYTLCTILTAGSTSTRA